MKKKPRALGLGLLAVLCGLLGAAVWWKRPAVLRGSAQAAAEFRRRVDEIDRQTKARQITVEELKRSLGRGLLLDVREPEEYQAGAIPGAVRVEPGTPLEAIPALPEAKSSPIVTYCTAGYRSGILARKLAEAGYTHARNLHGGLIAWANASGKIEAPRGGPGRVHPWSREWAVYLKPGVSTAPLP